MTRKLFSVMLSAFALLLLMGAGTAPWQTAALLAEEESATAMLPVVLETDVQSMYSVNGLAVQAAVGANPLKMAENVDRTLIINNAYASADMGKFQRGGITYVALASMALALDENAQINWDGENTATVTTEDLTLSASVGDPYVVANGRYLYVAEGVQLVDGRVTVPVSVVIKAFDAALLWDSTTGVITVNSGSGAISSAEEYYNEEDLFWLSRVIYAESGNQPMEGKIAVGNVVMNRVSNPIYPDTVQGVLAQKNQFSTYKNGKLADRTPNESSVIAAKMVLDGAVLEETRGALYFDSATRSWASRNKECIAVIGGHKFYA